VRLTAAIGVIAVSLATALYVHQRNPRSAAVTSPKANVATGPPTTGFLQYNVAQVRKHPSWEDPVAVGIAAGGIIVAASIITFRRPYLRQPS
jgi:hypothetical protein